MSEFLAITFSFPTVIYTVLLGVLLCYWLLVIIGAMDMDRFNAGGMDGAADGALDGLGHGATDGALDGLGHGAADGALDGLGHGAMDGVADGALDGLGHGAMDGVADGALDGVADGALDGAADAAAHGALHAGAHGVAHGAVEGAAHGALPGAVKGAVHGASDGAGAERYHGMGADGTQAYTPDGILGILHHMGLLVVPLTISMSVLCLSGFIMCYIASRLIFEYTGTTGLVYWAAGTGIFFVVLVVSGYLAGLCVKPLRGTFRTVEASPNVAFVGKIAHVLTGKVSESFGQADVHDGGAGLVVQVRCRTPNELVKGSEVILYRYDRGDEVFHVAATVKDSEQDEMDSREDSANG